MRSDALGSVMPRRPSCNPWSQLELRVCRQSAQLLLRGKFPSASDAARSAEREIEQLHRKRPGERWASASRTHDAVLRKILRLVHASRGKWPHAAYSREENAILDRHARALTKRPSLPVKLAGQACWEELERRHLRTQRGLPPELRAPQPRSLASVRACVRTKSLALGRAKRNAMWTPAEMAIVMKCRRKLLRARELDGRPLKRNASRFISTELKRHGFDRTPDACKRADCRPRADRKR